jgi:predicted ribonuclease YlaK
MSKKNINLSQELLDELQEVERISKITFTTKDLKSITPITENQKKMFKYYDGGYSLLLQGTPGTGKTFLAFYKAIYDVLDTETKYKKVVIVRSAVATRDMGFMPGTEEEKLNSYERPYMAIADEIFNYKSKNYDNLKSKGMVEFISTSFIRGITIRDAIVIVDEVENLNYHEIKSIFTRLGKHTKIIFCGDVAQTDLIKNSRDGTGLVRFTKVVDLMASMRSVVFTSDDIVRDEIVREFILADEEVDKENPLRIDSRKIKRI